MGLINLASRSSTWRGLDYYNEKKVSDYKKIDENELKEALIETLDISPEWVYDRFVRDRVGY